MSDLLDIAPSLPRYAPEGEAALLAGREPGLGEFLGASVDEGWWNTGAEAAATRGREVAGARRDATPLTREDWQGSGLARDGLSWDERMTRGRAEAMARTFDENAYRRNLMAARDPGGFEAALGFGGMLVGAIADPLNFLPVAGPLAAGARAAGLARTAAVLARPGVGGSALRGTVDALGGTVVAAPLTYSTQARYGDEITFDRVLADLAIGATIGAGFGAAGGLLGRVQPDALASVRALDAAARDVAAGRPPEVPAGLVTRAVEDAVARAAPPELRGVTLAELPTSPEGLPVTRAEFAALMDRERLTHPVTMEDLEARDRGEAAANPQARPVLDLLDAMKRGEDKPKGEKSLTQFVVENGGIRDERGDVRNMMGDGTRTRPGLLNDARGLPADEMAEKARAAGYFPEFGEADDAGYGMKAFLEALDEDLNKSRVRLGRTEDARARQTTEALGDLDRLLERNGASITDPPDRILEVLRGLREDAPTRTLDDLVREDDAYGWYRDALDARRNMDRLSTSAPAAEPRAPLMDAAPAAANAPDPDMAALDALRAEGRVSPADEAILRAGNDAADELDAAANGLEEAGACLLRNLA